MRAVMDVWISAQSELGVAKSAHPTHQKLSFASNNILSYFLYQC